MVKISIKDDILTVKLKIALLGNKINRNLEMSQFQRDVEVWKLKASKMRMKAHIEGENIIYIWKRYVEIFKWRSITMLYKDKI